MSSSTSRMTDLTLHTLDVDRECVRQALKTIALITHVIKRGMPGLPEIEDIWLPRPERDRLNNTPTRVSRWKMVKINLQESKKRLSDELDTYLKSILAPRCLQTCISMQEKLPRDLRDKIYTFLLDNPKTDIDEGNFEPIGIPSFSGLPSISGADHLRNEQFVDSATLHELLRVWYISRDFCFDENASVLAKLMDHDMWGHSLPVYDLVKRVSITWWNDQSFFDGFFENELERVKEEILGELETLFLLKPGTQINMIFHNSMWPIDDENARVVVAIWSRIFPLLSRLVDAGYRVAVDVIMDVEFDVVKDEINEETWKRKILEIAAENDKTGRL